MVTKGMTMRKFLEAVRKDLLQEFPELRSVSVENLMYVVHSNAMITARKE